MRVSPEYLALERAKVAYERDPSSANGKALIDETIRFEAECQRLAAMEPFTASRKIAHAMRKNGEFPLYDDVTFFRIVLQA